MYILEGNIGAGKSTFLKLLEQHAPAVQVAQEPVNTWQKNVHGQSVLANFYEDPHRWAYSMETFTMMCRVREHIQDQEHAVFGRIIERSIYSGHYCFSQLGYKNGYMDTLEWNMYEAWFNFLIPQKCRPPHGFIYLQTTPDIAFKRIKKRNRLAEKQITYAYLKQTHEYHEKFLLHKENILPSIAAVPVLVLDGNHDFEQDLELFATYVEQIQNFMMQTIDAHRSASVASPDISL